MTSQIRPHKKILHCNKDLERDKQYVAEISSPEQVAWIWCIATAFLIPELGKPSFGRVLNSFKYQIQVLMTFPGTLFRSSRICIFKSARRCTFSDFLVVLLFEAMHVVGLALLFYVVLPELDVVKGAMLTNCVAFIPAVFGKFEFSVIQMFFSKVTPNLEKRVYLQDSVHVVKSSFLYLFGLTDKCQ